MDRRLAGSADRELVEAFARLAIVLARLVEVAAVALPFEAWQQRLDGRAHVTHHAHVDRRPPPDHLAASIDLGYPHAVPARIELPIGKIGPEHEQNVAIEHGVIARRKPDQPGHADVVGIVPLDMFFALEGVDDRSLQALREREQLRVCALAPGAAQHGHAAVAVENGGQSLEIGGGRRHRRLRRQQTRWLGHRCVCRGLQRDVAGDDHHRDTALRHRRMKRHLQGARHLVGAGDQLAKMAALLEQVLRVRLLEIAGGDFPRRDLGGDGEHR
jgi:hypothetical protein